jgi:hypothetical protein
MLSLISPCIASGKSNPGVDLSGDVFQLPSLEMQEYLPSLPYATTLTTIHEQ